MRWKEKLTKPFDLFEISRVRPYLMGIATLWITFYHCKYLNLFNSAFLTRTRLLGLFTRVETIGNCGVDLFFFLSGLGLYFSYTRLREKEPHPLRAFYRRRYRKILPTILIVTVLTFGMVEKADLANWAGGVFLYGLYWPTLERGNFWYLSATVVLYLFFPLIYRGIQRKRAAAGTAGMILAAVALAMGLRTFAREYYYTHAILMVCRIPVFILGAYTGRLCCSHRKIPAWIPMLAVPLSAVLVILIADLPLDTEWRFYEYTALIPCLALAHAYVFSKFRKWGFLSRLVMMIGTYSMEIYLIFESVYNHGTDLIFSPEDTGLVYALTAFTATLVLAVLLKEVVNRLLRVFDEQGVPPESRKGAVQ